MTQTFQHRAPEEARKGLACRACGCRHFRVLYTRRAMGERLLRRRECRHCGRRITTSEAAAGANPARG